MGRVRKDCPVPGCSAKNLSRLPNHLSLVHQLDSKSRTPWLKKTKKNTMSEVISTLPKSAVTWSPDAVIDSAKPWWETQSLTPFEPCSSIIISGPTCAGKSYWTYKLLKHLEGMFVKNPPKKILYCFGVFQSLFDEMERTIPNIVFQQGLPTEADLEEFASGEHRLIILDDLLQQVIASKEMELLFTQGCHHRHLSVIFITQNLFSQGKSARTIALNTWYLVLFKNVRDTSQIMTLGRQLFPGRAGILVDAYTDAVKEPYGYLTVDMSPRAEDKLRLRTRIFPGEDTVVYVPRL